MDDLPFDAEVQFEFARQVFSDSDVVDRIREFLSPRDRAVVIGEQHFVALSRLLVLGAREAVLEDLDPRESPIIERTLLGMSALSDRATTDESTRDNASSADWLPFLVQNGAFNGKEPLLEAFGRVTAMLALSRSEEAKARQDYCDLDAWALASCGVSLPHQLASALAVLGSSGALSGGPPQPATALLAPDYFVDLADHLQTGPDGARALRDLLSADRLWYAAEFRRIEGELALDAHAAAAGYNRAPFEARPFLRLSDGRYLLWSPRTIVSWMTDGFYYRALDTARAVGRREQFLTFWGYLVERYSRDVVAAAHPEPRPAGSGRVHGERPYGSRKRRKLSPDVTIDLGPDVVFMEVVSGRLSLEARVGGRATKIADEITKMVAAKGRQLSNRIDDFLAGDFGVPGVDGRHVERIWPVVITGPGLLMTEVLWEEIEQRMRGALCQTRVRPLTVLDLADLEQLAGLVEAGWGVPALLERKTGAYRRLDWRRMVAEDPALPDRRAAQVLARWEEAWRTTVRDLGWDPESFQPEHHASAA